MDAQKSELGIFVWFMTMREKETSACTWAIEI